MARFAQIDQGIVIATLDTNPPLPMGRISVDITDRPEVIGGETYDPQTGTFTAAAPHPSAVFPSPLDTQLAAILNELTALKQQLKEAP